MARFPDGRFGVGLLILRTAFAAMVWSASAGAWTRSSPGLLLVGPVFICLCIGLLTPWVGALGGLVMLVTVVAVPELRVEQGAQWLAIAASVALLGPGAYSVDARLSGHRRRVFPPEDESA